MGPLCVCLSVLWSVHGSGGQLVKTSQGELAGSTFSSRAGRTFHTYRMPYAEPPTGNLRFMPPVPKKKWNGVLNATGSLPICYQLMPYELGQEDCLYLSVSTPNLKPKKPMPVIFFIHYGAYVKGFAGPEDAGKYFMDEDVVLVLIHYRLGIFGFLSLETPELPGNQAVKDSALALQWTASEIANFGGDPKRITVMGNSAGASIAELLATSPQTSKLVAGCISLSGVSSATWAISKPGQARSIALQLGKELGCPDEKTMVSCLQAKPAKEVIVDSTKGVSLGFAPTIEPVGEGAIITEWPPKEARKFPWILGNTANEGILQAGYIEYMADKSVLSNYTDQWETFFPDAFNLENPEDAAKLHDRYFTNENPYRAIEHLYRDAYFIYPSLKSAKIHGTPIYYYRFNYIGGPTLYEMRRNKKMDGAVQGSCHADDIYYYFQFYGIPIPAGWPSSKDVEVSKTLIKLMVNFAATQNPTFEMSEVKWPQFSSREFLEITNDGFIVKEFSEMEDIMKFWDSIKYHALFKYHDL